MNFLSYVVLGGLSYAAGWAIRIYILGKQPKPAQPYGLKHPVILGYLGAFFIIMLIVSWLIGRYLLGHVTIDLPFIIINSLVATFVYSFGLNPENANYEVPD
ncbi:MULTISPECIES: hypothetical protein [unclassified Psychrobacter]|jgi:hypothetical protein|uniref:hypothetical protein n=1 Tax=unclassified Psychrobacter TaxID=196806 RepID=UPI00071E71F7|nr:MULTISPECIES: hypothetical protein [unclassified Psychrobacter]OLF36202.1 hypothetical protein BTV98_11730 [Psychrobacter sp. Cmf 22.2]